MAQSGVYSRYGKSRENESKTIRNGKALTVNQVKDRLNCSRSHVQNLISSGKLKSFRIGETRGIRVYESEIERITCDRDLEE